MPTSIDHIIVIGGSAGSLPVLLQVLENLPPNFSIPVIVVLHRLKNVASDLQGILASVQQTQKIKEPEDKEAIKRRHVYIAPQNYHLLVEADKTFSLDYSEPVHYSRPSIDVSFESVVRVFGPKTIAILLSGANQDGADGMEAVVAANGVAIAQSPETSEYPAMPVAAIEKNAKVKSMAPEKIVEYLHQLTVE
ncbi:chemotaxis protein CheB [Deminuibacter soli]|nr:chemotaxis protein CheB [Deminuibacter soli]